MHVNQELQGSGGSAGTVCGSIKVAAFRIPAGPPASFRDYSQPIFVLFLPPPISLSTYQTIAVSLSLSPLVVSLFLSPLASHPIFWIAQKMSFTKISFASSSQNCDLHERRTKSSGFSLSKMEQTKPEQKALQIKNAKALKVIDLKDISQLNELV